MLYYFEFKIDKNKLEIVEANFDSLQMICHPSYDGWPTFSYYKEYRVASKAPCYMHRGNFREPNCILNGIVDANSVEDAEKVVRKMLEDYLL